MVMRLPAGPEMKAVDWLNGVPLTTWHWICPKQGDDNQLDETECGSCSIKRDPEEKVSLHSFINPSVQVLLD